MLNDEVSKVFEVFVLFRYERDVNGSWEDVVAIFKNPTTEQLATKISCSKVGAKELLEGKCLHFKGKVYDLVSHVIE